MSSLIGESSDFFMRAMMGYRVTKCLLVANKLGVCDALAKQPMSAFELAKQLRCEAGKLQIFLQALAGLDVLAVEDGRFRNTALAEQHLVSGRPGYMGNNLSFQDMLWENWTHLEEVVRQGSAWKSLEELLGAKDQSFTEQYIRGMHNISGPSAEDVARLLSDRPMRRLLDLGAGPGRYTTALLDRNPQMAAVLFDLPTTLEVTRDYCASLIGQGRAELRSGNYLKDTYGSGFDLVLMSHITHDEGPDDVLRMSQRAFAALNPGGRLAYHDWVLDERGQPLAAALFSVNLSVYTNSGKVYSVDEYSDILRRAGFTDVRVHTVLEGKVGNPTTLVVGTKP